MGASLILEDLIALLDFKIAYKESKELHFKESEEISAKQKQAKEILEKIPDQKDKEIQKIYKDFSKLLQTPATSQNFDGISHSYSAIISQLKQHKEQTTHLLNKYGDNALAYAITHKRLMEENISDPVGIFTILSALKKSIDERISKRQEIVKHPNAKAIGLPRLMLPIGKVWFSLCVPNHRDFTEFELQRIPYRSHTSYLQRRNFAYFLR